MTTTPADPSAIDLQYLWDAAELADTVEQHDLWLQAAAAVEALRERVAELEGIKDDWIKAGILRGERADQAEGRAEAAEARATEAERLHNLYKHVAKSVRGALDGEHTQRDILKVFDEQIDRAESAEARVVELAAALKWALDTLDVNDKFIFEELGAECNQRIDQAAKAKARAALAATPEDALGKEEIPIRTPHKPAGNGD